MPLKIVKHAVLEDILARLRDKRTPPEAFRALARRAGVILSVEATADLPQKDSTVETPLEPAGVKTLGGGVVAVPVLRAGLGLLEAFLEVVPSARVGYYGLERNEETALARCYYEKVPGELASSTTFILDPMLATGGSAAIAAEHLKGKGARSVRLVSVVAAPEGVKHLESLFPEVAIFVASLDSGLNARKYILPGLGDFGDRLFDT